MNRFMLLVFLLVGSVLADEPTEEDINRIKESIPRMEALKTAKDLEVPAKLLVRKEEFETETEWNKETKYTYYRGKNKLLEVVKDVSKKDSSTRFRYYFFWKGEKVASGGEDNKMVRIFQKSSKVKVSYTVTKEAGKPDIVGICSSDNYLEMDMIHIDGEKSQPISGLEMKRNLLIGEEAMKIIIPIAEKVKAEQSRPAKAGQ